MISTKILQGLSVARSGLYFLESLPVMAFNRLAHPDLHPPSTDQVKDLWRSTVDLHARDAERIAKGVYPFSCLEFERPWTHLRTYTDVLADGLRVAWRMRRNGTKDVGDQADAPEYYARNFHFQTDGYFSEASARRYDHQVEILFHGTAGAMRRLILPPMRQHLGEKPKILEIGCGTGSATRLVATTFTEAKITALDMSSAYLKVAQDQLRSFPKVGFLQGDGTQLDFKDNTFDCVFSVYLLHELPAPERERVIKEAWRVLRPGGLLVFADSLQWDDAPNLNWALERFPKIYHEPFYKNYVMNKLESLITGATGSPTQSEHGLFTKVVWAKKS